MESTDGECVLVGAGVKPGHGAHCLQQAGTVVWGAGAAWLCWVLEPGFVSTEGCTGSWPHSLRPWCRKRLLSWMAGPGLGQG